MKKIRMAIIRPYAAPMDLNSYNSQELGLAKGLSKLSIDVDIFMAGWNKQVEVKSYTSKEGGTIRIYELPYYKLPLIQQAIFPHLKKLILKNNYDFIQVNEKNEITSFLMINLCKHTLKIPVVVYQGMYQDISGRIMTVYQKIFDKLLLPKMIKNIAIALAKTKRAQLYLKDHGFENISVLPVGLDESSLMDVDKNWNDILNIKMDDKIVTYVGVFEKRRNIHFMLDIAKDCINDKIKFVFVGSGPDSESVKNRVRDEKIDNVILVGRVEQKYLSSLYKMSHLFLLPSGYEIYGMVVLEAMYFGVPVISTKTAGPEDIIEHGVDGLLIEELDVLKWSREIKRLFTNRNKLNEMSEKARTKIRNEYLWDIIAIKYHSEIIEKYCCK